MHFLKILYNSSCSVTCYKTHKAGASCAVKDLDVGCSQGNENAMETEAPDAERITKHRRKPVTTKKYMFPTKDTVSLEGLEKLNKERKFILLCIISVLFLI